MTSYSFYSFLILKRNNTLHNTSLVLLLRDFFFFFQIIEIYSAVITPAALSNCCHDVVFFRLKDQLLKERSESSDLNARIEALEGRCQSLTQQLEQARSKEEQHKSTLLRLEESVSQGEAIRSRQQAEEVLWPI